MSIKLESGNEQFAREMAEMAIFGGYAEDRPEWWKESVHIYRVDDTFHLKAVTPWGDTVDGRVLLLEEDGCLSLGDPIRRVIRVGGQPERVETFIGLENVPALTGPFVIPPMWDDLGGVDYRWGAGHQALWDRAPANIDRWSWEWGSVIADGTPTSDRKVEVEVEIVSTGGQHAQRAVEVAATFVVAITPGERIAPVGMEALYKVSSARDADSGVPNPEVTIFSVSSGTQVGDDTMRQLWGKLQEMMLRQSFLGPEGD